MQTTYFGIQNRSCRIMSSYAKSINCRHFYFYIHYNCYIRLVH